MSTDIVHHTMAESTGFLSACIVMLLLAAAVPGYVALKTGSDGGTATLRKWVPMLNLFAGAVFLSAALLHLIPEATEGYQNYVMNRSAANTDDNNDTVGDYPLPCLFVLLGFWIVMAVEQLAVQYADKVMSVSSSSSSSFEQNTIEDLLLASDGDNAVVDADGGGGGGGGGGDADRGARNDSAPGHHHHNHHADPLEAATSGGYVVLAALSVHSLLEGIGLGSQQSIASASAVAIAIIIHKGIAAFALGLRLAPIKTSWHRLLVCMAVFSAASPLGIVIGMIAQSNGSDLLLSSINGLSAGTFLYVGVIEMLAPELEKDTASPLFSKTLPVTAGMAVFALLALLPDGDG